MEYRLFGKLDFQVSALGFGCMRLPTLGARDQIDEREAERMLYYAIDQGVNYVDTAYGYHGGNSERFLGRALNKGGYRDKIKLATKLPCGEVKEPGDFDRLLNEQLSKLQTDHIDFYLLHGLRRQRWDLVKPMDITTWLEGAKADGRIRHIGFSFHDTLDVFKEIIDDYEGWEFCQIQYNYMNEDYQAGTEGMQYAASKGLAVVVMEPLLGGRLVDPPLAVQEVWDNAEQKRNAAGWGLQWVWNHPEVSVVLSGMTAMEHVQENIQSAERSGVGILTQEEQALIAKAQEQYESLCPVPCTDCNYCMPCPNGVNIPRNFSDLNRGVMYNSLDEARGQYARMNEDQRASACIQCRECEEKCPQDILISQWMPIVHQVLGEGKPYEPTDCPKA